MGFSIDDSQLDQNWSDSTSSLSSTRSPPPVSIDTTAVAPSSIHSDLTLPVSAAATATKTNRGSLTSLSPLLIRSSPRTPLFGDSPDTAKTSASSKTSSLKLSSDTSYEQLNDDVESCPLTVWLKKLRSGKKDLIISDQDLGTHQDLGNSQNIGTHQDLGNPQNIGTHQDLGTDIVSSVLKTQIENLIIHCQDIRLSLLQTKVRSVIANMITPTKIARVKWFVGIIVPILSFVINRIRAIQPTVNQTPLYNCLLTIAEYSDKFDVGKLCSSLLVDNVENNPNVLCRQLLVAETELPKHYAINPPSLNVTYDVYKQSSDYYRAQFTRQIISITKSSFVAIGYGLSNTMVICTDSGLLVVDTLDSRESMREFIKDFTSILINNNLHVVDLYQQKTTLSGCRNVPFDDTTGKPRVRAIIYSHFHSDHLFGAPEIYEKNFTDVYSHSSTQRSVKNVMSHLAGVTTKRAVYQFGTVLSTENGDFAHAGIGPFFRLSSASQQKPPLIIPATHTWDTDKNRVTISGVDIDLLYAPGESNDQNVVWFANERILYAADNVYRAFPNIYPLRGEQPRDPMKWIQSLELMRTLRPKFLILGHTLPVVGEDEIYNILTDYRDAILFVHDQTLRYINKGHTADEITKLVALPPHLKAHEFLNEHYGAVAWSVRAIYDFYLGWYSGHPEDLRPLEAYAKAQRMASLAGGVKLLITTAAAALATRDYQWALELSYYGIQLEPDNVDIKRTRVAALRHLASLETASSGRNWYLTSAVMIEDPDKVEKAIKVTPDQQKAAIYSFSSPVDLLHLFPVRWQPELFTSDKLIVRFIFSDEHEEERITSCVHFTKAAAFVRTTCEAAIDITVTLSSKTFKEILVNELSVLRAATTLQLRIWPVSPHLLSKLRNAMAAIDHSS